MIGAQLLSVVLISCTADVLPPSPPLIFINFDFTLCSMLRVRTWSVLGLPLLPHPLINWLGRNPWEEPVGVSCPSTTTNLHSCSAWRRIKDTSWDHMWRGRDWGVLDCEWRVCVLICRPDRLLTNFQAHSYCRCWLLAQKMHFTAIMYLCIITNFPFACRQAVIIKLVEWARCLLMIT